MRAILEVFEGPLAGRRIEVYPGHSYSFGRTVKADIAVPGDGYMSGRHFAVENTGDVLLVHDLGSSNGTFVNGVRVEKAPAVAQDIIAAGSSKFRLNIEYDDPAAAVGLMSRTSTMPRNNAAPPLDQTQLGDFGGATRVIYPSATGVETLSKWQGFSPPQAAMLDALYATSGSVYVYLNTLRDPLIQAFEIGRAHV